MKEQNELSHELAFELDEKKIDALFADVNQCHLPGAAAGISINGRPVYRKGFGLANQELPVVLTPSTRMRIYSITKHFTCLAYLLLCEQGMAGIDDPLGKHFPELHPVTHQVTMRQLMGNISGLRDAHGLNLQFCGLTKWLAPGTEVVALYRNIDDVDAQAGTAWMYNNGGFVLLSHAIERISGQTLAQFMRVRIFDPLGMHDTLLRHFDTDFVAGSAALHATAPSGGFMKLYTAGDRSGTGGIVSTVNDMLCWLAHMDAPRVGSPATWALMRTPQTLANGTSTGYGFGLARDSYRGVETLYHTGGGVGGNARILKVPAASLDIVVIANRDDVVSWELPEKILDACLPGLERVREPIKVPLVSGVFSSRATGRVIRLFPQNGQQMAEIAGLLEMPFAPDDAGVLRPAGTLPLPYKHAITLTGDRANPAALRYSDYGNVDEMVPVEPIDDPDLNAIAGRYRCEAAGFEATIAGNAMRTVGRFGSVQYSLECLAHDIWRVKEVSNLTAFMRGILSFDESGFRFWSNYTRSLPFRRVG